MLNTEPECAMQLDLKRKTIHAELCQVNVVQANLSSLSLTYTIHYLGQGKFVMAGDLEISDKSLAASSFAWPMISAVPGQHNRYICLN